jgi:hypothetical protein
MNLARCPLAVLAALALTSPAFAADKSRAFLDFAVERCIGPMERGEATSREDLKLSARSVALIPGLSNSALAYETRDGLFFVSVDIGKSFSRCTVGLRDPNLRRVADIHATVIAEFQAMTTAWLGDARYSVIDLVEDGPRLEIGLESTNWRDPRLRIGFFSDPELGRLHLFVQDVEDIVDEEAEDS